MKLSSALSTLIKTKAMKYVQAEVIKRTVFAALWSALSPTTWTQIIQVIGKSRPEYARRRNPG